MEVVRGNIGRRPVHGVLNWLMVYWPRYRYFLLLEARLPCHSSLLCVAKILLIRAMT